MVCSSTSSQEEEFMDKTNQEFDLESYLQSMESKPDSHLDHIATYIRFKKFPIASKEQMSVYIKRNLRVAKDLTAFTSKEIQRVMQKLEDDYQWRIKTKGKSDDWKWTLETVLKELMK